MSTAGGPTETGQPRKGKLQQQMSTRSKELETDQLKLRQLCDESSISAKNSMQSLVQTQYVLHVRAVDPRASDHGASAGSQDTEQVGAHYLNYMPHQKLMSAAQRSPRSSTP
ncbi:hypothetical protein KR054_004029 [Drosophila jambulina]|nr:hypothetical protein KR054_004029 [Drosophila jambulina]